jgi:hypothetical protein
LLAWGATASARILRIVHRSFKECQPSLDGFYTEESGHQIRCIREYLGRYKHCPTEIEPGNNPFAVYSMTDLRYTDEEYKEDIRGSRLRPREHLVLFNKLAINERNGDRLLFICRDPR